MEKQLSEFVAQQLREKESIEYPEQVLTLLIGHQACAAHETWAQAMRKIWQLDQNSIQYHGFVASSDADCEYACNVTHLSGTGFWTRGDIPLVNEAMQHLADQFAEQYLPNQVICAFVCADDPLADKAADLLSLMSRWYHDVCDENAFAGMRPMLFLLLPDRTSMDEDKAERAFALVNKLKERKADPIFNPNYKSAPGSAFPLEFERNMEVFLLDAPDALDQPLADAAYLMAPMAKSGSGLFLSAFEDVPGVYKHRLIRQLTSCLSQLKDTDGKGAAPSRTDIVDDLRHIVREEGERADFGRWMGHSCVMRCLPHPNMNEQELYGDWLQGLTLQWCRMFENQALPESRLAELLENCPDQELMEYKVSLSSHVMRQMQKTGRTKPPARADDWRTCLNQAIVGSYNELQQQSRERRLNALVQRMLTLVNERLANRYADSFDSASDLLTMLRSLERRTLQKSGFTPVEMEPNECVRFTQILHMIGHGDQKDYTSLLTMAQALIDRAAGPEPEKPADPKLCCAHNYLLDWRSRLQRSYQLQSGGRSGQVLYTLRLSDNPSEMNLDRIRFFEHCNKYCRRNA